MSLCDLRDADTAAAVLTKLEDEACFVQLTLDAGHVDPLTERRIRTAGMFPDNFVAIGRAADLPMTPVTAVIVDGLTLAAETVSRPGELRVTRDPALAADCRAYVDLVHQHMLQPATRAITTLTRGGQP
jgi:hypothetical protein